MSLHKDLLSGVVILILCCLCAMSVAQLPDPDVNEAVGPASLPKISLIALAICGIIQVVRGLRKGGHAEDAKYNFCGKSVLFYLFYIVYMIAMVMIGDLFIAMNWVRVIPYAGGFAISTVLFLVISFKVLGRKRLIEILSVSFITTAVLAVSFGGFFKIILP